MGYRSDRCSKLARFIHLCIYLLCRPTLLVLGRGTVYSNLNVYKAMSLELPFREAKITFKMVLNQALIRCESLS